MTTVADWRAQATTTNNYLATNLEFFKGRLKDNMTNRFREHVRTEIMRNENEDYFRLNIYYKNEDFDMNPAIKHKLQKNDWDDIASQVKTNLSTLMPGIKTRVTNSLFRMEWTDNSI